MMNQTNNDERCGTPRCRGPVVMTYLGKPLCQRCWDTASMEIPRGPLDGDVRKTSDIRIEKIVRALHRE